jgi:hypothetical protein
MESGNENESKPLSELEREAEASRASLMNTVDSLQSRVSGRAIKEDIKEYVRDTSNGIIHSVERRIRENPLQAAAIAIGLAYPFWRLVSNIPAPIALIGAGIALTQGGARLHSGPAVSDRHSTNSRSLTQQFASAARSAKDKIYTLGEQTAGKVGDALHAAEDMAAESGTAASDAVSQVYRAGAHIAEKTSEEVQQTVHRTQDAFVEAVQNHPLVLGGVGLLVGGFFASCIPATAAENQAFGQISDAIKDQARDMAAEGVGAMKAAGHEVYDHAVSGAQEHGLTSDVVRDTVREVGEKVRTVAQKATDRLEHLGTGQAGQKPTLSGEQK